VIESIQSNEGQIVIRDLKSSNSTFVNNIKITEAYLNIGDEIVIGKHVLRLQYGKDKEPSIDRSIESTKDVSIPHEDTFVLDNDKRDEILKKIRSL
ncbi:MAG: FHA domain-containing protein, partial [Thermodesulfobacteriota bacterium]